MGLDVYVGSMTRYYTRQWETVVQKMARETGMHLKVVRQNDSPPPRPDEMAPLASSWRDGISKALQPHGIAPFTWDESVDSPYFTDKPAWDCYSALMLWASHSEHPDTPLPGVAPKEWASYPPYMKSQEQGQTQFPHLLRDTEFWLPTPLPFTFRATDLTGNNICIGSVQNLKAELDLLNELTWRASPQLISQWRHDGADFGASLEVSARFAFAVFLELASAACVNGLPMKLDY